MKTDKSKFQQGTFNLYEAEHLPETHKEFYEQQKINLPEHPVKIPGHIKDEVLILHHAKQDKNYLGEITYSLDTYPYPVLISEKGTICKLVKAWNVERYRFAPFHNHYIKAFKVNHHKRGEVSKGLKEPNKIGAWTDKKVNDWLEYCDKYVELMNNLAEEYTSEHDKNMKIIQDFIESLPKATVSRGDNKTYIDTALFYVTFTHDPGVTYLRKEITYKGTIEDISKIENKL